ncbi:hypothetical protein RI129_013075 [Pyrocoelia pectoralis]|uniref:Uncharacterized protein n=1 Tax=Pyrocoelia pectoralis TaxID=417401 RepID=A0AAN7Z7A3_9COLE
MEPLKENEVNSHLQKIIIKLQTEVKLLMKQNSLLKTQISENLDESTSMESTLNDENSRLVKLVYQLKIDNKNLCREITDLKCKLELKCKRIIDSTPKGTQTEVVQQKMAASDIDTIKLDYDNQILELNKIIKDQRLEISALQEKIRKMQTRLDANLEESTAMEELLIQDKNSTIFNSNRDNSQLTLNENKKKITQAAAENQKSLLAELRDIGALSCDSIVTSIDNCVIKTTGTSNRNVKPPLPELNNIKNREDIKIIGNRNGNSNFIEKRKKKILILGDSQTRDMGLILKSLLSTNFIVSNIFKPNGLLEDVVINISELTTEFSCDDFVIILAGSNNGLKGTKFDPVFLTKICEVKNKTNLILISTPFHHNKPLLNNFIYENNDTIFNHLNSDSLYNYKYIDINSLVSTNDFTKHGLHLRYNGKLKLLKHVIKITNNFSLQYCDYFINKSNLVYPTIETTNKNDYYNHFL